MLAQWLIGISGITWIIDLIIPSGAKTQIVVIPNLQTGGTPPEYTFAQIEDLATAVNTAASTLGTTDFNTMSGTDVISPILIMSPEDWDLYDGTWVVNPGDFPSTVYLFLKKDGILTSTQQASLVSAYTAAINALTAASGVVLTKEIVTPNSIVTDSTLSAYSATCSANYTSTTAGDLAGTSISVVVTKANSTITATGVFDMQSGTATGACAGIFNWNGADQAGRAGVGGPVGTRSTAQQTWIVTGVSPGTYTAKLRGSVNTGGTIRSTNTTLSINIS